MLSRFRRDFHACLRARADELSELADAVLCADGPVRDLAGLSLAAEHRRGHGALYDAVNCGRVDIGRLRRALAGLWLPRAADGRLVLAADVSNWLRPGAATSPDRLFCHVCGRGKGQAQMIPGWPYPVIAAREPGRASRTAVLAEMEPLRAWQRIVSNLLAEYRLDDPGIVLHAPACSLRQYSTALQLRRSHASVRRPQCGMIPISIAVLSRLRAIAGHRQ